MNCTNGWTVCELYYLNKIFFFKRESYSPQFSSVQSLSRVWLFMTPWIAACQASLSITNSQSSPKFTCIELVMPSSHFILCRPPLHLSPNAPSIRVFPNVSTFCMRWPKYWSFSLSISPSNEHPGLVSFRMDWLDLFAVQGTLKSLLQHHNSKASILLLLAESLESWVLPLRRRVVEDLPLARLFYVQSSEQPYEEVVFTPLMHMRK